LKLRMIILPLDTSPSWHVLTFCDEQYEHDQPANLWGGSSTSVIELASEVFNGDR